MSHLTPACRRPSSPPRRPRHQRPPIKPEMPDRQWQAAGHCLTPDWPDFAVIEGHRVVTEEHQAVTSSSQSHRSTLNDPYLYRKSMEMRYVIRIVCGDMNIVLSSSESCFHREWNSEVAGPCFNEVSPMTSIVIAILPFSDLCAQWRDNHRHVGLHAVFGESSLCLNFCVGGGATVSPPGLRPNGQEFVTGSADKKRLRLYASPYRKPPGFCELAAAAVSQ